MLPEIEKEIEQIYSAIDIQKKELINISKQDLPGLENALYVIVGLRKSLNALSKKIQDHQSDNTTKITLDNHTLKSLSLATKLLDDNYYSIISNIFKEILTQQDVILKQQMEQNKLIIVGGSSRYSSVPGATGLLASSLGNIIIQPGSSERVKILGELREKNRQMILIIKIIIDKTDFNLPYNTKSLIANFIRKVRDGNERIELLGLLLNRSDLTQEDFLNILIESKDNIDFIIAMLRFDQKESLNKVYSKGLEYLAKNIKDDKLFAEICNHEVNSEVLEILVSEILKSENQNSNAYLNLGLIKQICIDKQVDSKALCKLVPILRTNRTTSEFYEQNKVDILKQILMLNKNVNKKVLLAFLDGLTPNDENNYNIHPGIFLDEIITHPKVDLEVLMILASYNEADPNLLQKILKHDKVDSSVLEKLACNNNATEELLNQIYNHSAVDGSILRQLAKNPNANEELLTQIYKHPAVNRFVLWELAKHPNANEELLTKIYNHSAVNGPILRQLAKNPKAKEELLNQIYNHPEVNRFVLWELVKHPKANEELLTLIYNHSAVNGEVLRQLAKHPKANEELLTLIYNHPAVNRSVLWQLAKHPNIDLGLLSQIIERVQLSEGEAREIATFHHKDNAKFPYILNNVKSLNLNDKIDMILAYKPNDTVIYEIIKDISIDKKIPEEINLVHQLLKFVSDRLDERFKSASYIFDVNRGSIQEVPQELHQMWHQMNKDDENVLMPIKSRFQQLNNDYGSVSEHDMVKLKDLFVLKSYNEYFQQLIDNAKKRIALKEKSVDKAQKATSDDAELKEQATSEATSDDAELKEQKENADRVISQIRRRPPPPQ